MTEDVLKRAFEPFFSTKERGSGIGLASVQDFAQEMGGAACLDSGLGEGTAVYLFIPVSSLSDDAVSGDAVEAAPSNSPADARILVVEDEPYALEALTEMLENDGYRVTPASSAKEGMAILRDLPHEILLTDVVMPSTSGLELATWATDQPFGTSIVLLSGYIPGNEAMCPGWRFIRKPLNMAELREMLRSAVIERAD